MRSEELQYRITGIVVDYYNIIKSDDAFGVEAFLWKKGMEINTNLYNYIKFDLHAEKDIYAVVAKTNGRGFVFTEQGVYYKHYSSPEFKKYEDCINENSFDGLRYDNLFSIKKVEEMFNEFRYAFEEESIKEHMLEDSVNALQIDPEYRSIYAQRTAYRKYADITHYEKGCPSLKQLNIHKDEKRGEECFHAADRVKKDGERFLVYKEGAQCGNSLCMIELADMYIDGNKIPRNYRMAASYLFLPAIEGNARAQFLLYTVLAKWDNYLNEALDWLCKSAEDGWIAAFVLLKHHYQHPVLKEMIHARLMNYVKQVYMIKNKDWKENKILGLCFACGICVQQNDSKAYLYLKKAQELGDSWAKIAIENSLQYFGRDISGENKSEELYEDGQAVFEDYEEKPFFTIDRLNKLEKQRQLIGSTEGMLTITYSELYVVDLQGRVSVYNKNHERANDSVVSAWRGICLVSGRADIFGLRFDGTVIGSDEEWNEVTSDWTDIVSISVSSTHIVGLKSNGTVVARKSPYSFYEDKGQCNVSGWHDIIAISAGNYYTLALNSDGTVFAVGDNSQGQCNVHDWTNIAAISAGYHHSVGLKSDGTVEATGGNQCEECNVYTWYDIVAVAASDNATIGVKVDGSIVSTKGCHIDVSQWTNVIRIAVDSSNGICGLTEDGYLFSSKYLDSSSPLRLFENLDDLTEERHTYETRWLKNRENELQEESSITQKIRGLTKERATLDAEANKLEGFIKKFLNKKRKQDIERRLLEIELELNALREKWQ